MLDAIVIDLDVPPAAVVHADVAVKRGLIVDLDAQVLKVVDLDANLATILPVLK